MRTGPLPVPHCSQGQLRAGAHPAPRVSRTPWCRPRASLPACWWGLFAVKQSWQLRSLCPQAQVATGRVETPQAPRREPRFGPRLLWGSQDLICCLFCPRSHCCYVPSHSSPGPRHRQDLLHGAEQRGLCCPGGCQLMAPETPVRFRAHVGSQSAQGGPVSLPHPPNPSAFDQKERTYPVQVTPPPSCAPCILFCPQGGCRAVGGEPPTAASVTQDGPR